MDTTYFEGSCGSGSVALAMYLNEGIPPGKDVHGTATFSLTQPEGTLEVTVETDAMGISKVFLAGHVELGEEMKVKI
jgi:diaminopimelate epimerase